MAVNLSPVGGVAGQFFDNNGNPLTGGKIYTYSAGTSTNLATYTSTAGVTAHTNPIILDAGGRVPGGEIWLTDGLQYKFVLKNSVDTLIGTYDNIIGINSNFINFLAQEEIQTATAGQTVFTLATVNYQPGTNSLSVFVDGVNQYDGSSYSYVETDGTTVTFTAGLHVGALVKFTTAQSLTSGATDASIVTYTPAGTGAVSTTVQAKLRESVSVLDFGADPTGMVNSTSEIQAAHDASVAAGSVYGFAEVCFTAGTYNITSLNWSPLVRIKCLGDVVFKSAIASGKCLHVSTQFGNWDTVDKQLYYSANELINGKIVFHNTLGVGANTACAIFFGDDGIATYSAENINIKNVQFRGWLNSHRFGSHAYMITFYDCKFVLNGDDIFVDVGAYIDRLERIQYINCTFANATNTINGDAGFYGDFFFSGCSFDYNTRMIANVVNIAIINQVNCHYEWSSDQTLLSANGVVSILNPLFVKPSGSDGVPMIASIGALGVFKIWGASYLTPTAAELYRIGAASGYFIGEKEYRQFGGSAATYINNVGGGTVSTVVSMSDFIGVPNSSTSNMALPNGLIVKTGTFTNTAIGANTTVNSAVTFPVAFPTACLFANVTTQPDASADFYGVTQIVTPIASGFTFAVRNGATPQNFTNTKWMAMGY